MGAAAGWYGGRFDALFLRVVEIMTAIPLYMMAIILVTVWGAGVEKIIIFLAAISWVGLARASREPRSSRSSRASTCSRRAPSGASDRRLLTQHILPNAAGPMVVGLVMAIPGDHLRRGRPVRPRPRGQGPDPELGQDDRRGRARTPRRIHCSASSRSSSSPVTMLAFTFVGDGLRDALDPNSKT